MEAISRRNIFIIRALVRPLKSTKSGRVATTSESGNFRVKPEPRQLEQESAADLEFLAIPRPSHSGQRKKYFSNWAVKSTTKV